MSQDTQSLKDELDILRHNTDKVSKLENTIQTYKIKLEEMSDLKNQIKLLETTNTKYMEQIIQMEEVCFFNFYSTTNRTRINFFFNFKGR
jgi:hypothetical protein